MQALSDDNRARSYILFEVKKVLHEMGDTLTSLSTYDLLTPKEELLELRAPAQSPQQIQSELQETVQTALPIFNELQRLVFNTVIGATLPSVSAESLQGLGCPPTAMKPPTHVIFLDGPCATGKTFLLKAI